MKKRVPKTTKSRLKTRVTTPRPAPPAKAGISTEVLRLKNILVPVDFSANSRKALRYAIHFARQFNSGISLLHVVKPLGAASEYGWADLPIIESQRVESGKEELSKWTAREVENGIPIQTSVRIGTPHHEIVEAARALQTDLIILSTHGRTGLKHVLMGSTAESVVRHAPCPVFVVREQERDFVTV